MACLSFWIWTQHGASVFTSGFPSKPPNKNPQNKTPPNLGIGPFPKWQVGFLLAFLHSIPAGPKYIIRLCVLFISLADRHKPITDVLHLERHALHVCHKGKVMVQHARQLSPRVDDCAIGKEPVLAADNTPSIRDRLGRRCLRWGPGE